MLFSSPVFIFLFLPIVLLVYYLILRKSRTLQNIFLFLASLFFYAWGEPKFVLVMVLSIIINWILGLLVHRYRERKKICMLLLTVDVALNLGLLFVFKYLNFANNIVHSLIGVRLGIPQIALPIGISFFTFQAMSYVLDVYREKGQVQKDILCVGLYISFFPQLIAGPIVRYETVANEIRNRKETLDDFFDGFARFVMGLAKKVLLSNSFALLADAVFDASAKGGAGLSAASYWLGAVAYAMQIFFDFGGYSDMAIGLGRMFGFHFLENFNYPYISKSVSEFWRRWHISLGSWFRDYVYFPLGGSRVKKGRMIFNLFVVWSLTGLWHGANFTFITWGLMYFCLLVFEKLTGFDKKQGKLLNVFKWLYTMVCVLLGWVLFRAENIANAAKYILSMFGLRGNGLIDPAFWAYLSQNLVLLLIGGLLCTPVMRTLRQRIKLNPVLEILHSLLLIGLFVLSIASLVSGAYDPFIYFNF